METTDRRAKRKFGPGIWLWIATFLAALVTGGTAEAKIPCVSCSEVDPRLIACPAGDSLFRVIVRDVSFNPLPGYSVSVEVCDCPGARIAPAASDLSYELVDACTAVLLTDVWGVADFYLRGGGGCSGSIDVWAAEYGIRLALPMSMASPDQDGDLVVDTQDLAMIESKLGTSDPTADLDGDGSVTNSDITIAQAHVGHMAQGVVGVPDDETSGPFVWLGQNRPNPYSGTTRISFHLPRAAAVTLRVFDVRGREVATILQDGRLGAGPHEFPFEARGLATGIYFYVLHGAGFSATRRMVLLQ